MGATADSAITVNLRTTGARVIQRDFGVIAHIDTGCLMSTDYELYTSPKDLTDAVTGGDLNAAAAAALAYFFYPDAHPSQVMAATGVYEATGAGSLGTALDAAYAAYPFYAFTIGSRALADLVAADAWALANKCFFLGSTGDADVLADTAGNVLELLMTTASGRSAVQYRATATEFADLAIASSMLGLSPDVGSASWRHQNVAGIAAEDITSAQKAIIDGNYGNVFVPLGGVSTFQKGVLTDGRPIDTLISRDWAAARCKERMIQRQLDMAALKRKIPYTDAGIAMCGSDVETTLKEGVELEHFEPGTISITLPKKASIPTATIQARQATIYASVKILNSIEEITLELSVLFA